MPREGLEGMFPVTTSATQLEPWERQLCLVEILLLSGGTPFANFKDLAHAWGREKGFHQILASNVCERRGEVDRKRRSDLGKVMSSDQRDALKKKRKATKAVLDESSAVVNNTQCIPAVAAAASLPTAVLPPVVAAMPVAAASPQQLDIVDEGKTIVEL